MQLVLFGNLAKRNKHYGLWVVKKAHEFNRMHDITHNLGSSVGVKEDRQVMDGSKPTQTVLCQLRLKISAAV